MRGLRFFLFACAVLSAFCAAALWRDQHNTFEKYTGWKSVKADLGLGVVGAQSFLVTPITMLGRSLNLGAWHGHQEVELAGDWEQFPRLSLMVYVEGNAELSLIAHSAGGQEDLALRVSTTELHPSAWIRLGKDRVFRAKQNLGYRLPERRWVKLTLGASDGRLAIFADKQKIGMVDTPPGVWRIALHGNSNEGVVRVDDISIHTPKRKYRQSFSGTFPYLIACLLAATLFGFFILLELMVAPGLAAGAALTCALTCGLVVWFYDSHIGNQYPLKVNFRDHPNRIPLRDEIMTTWQNLPPGPPVLLWLGGSQAWGAGASLPETSQFGLLKARLSSPSLEFVNGAISAAALEDQLETLRVVAARRVVKAVVITTGVNDSKNPEFAAKLALVAAAVKQRGAALLLVPEPMESPVSHFVVARQQEVKTFAEANGIPYVNLPEVFEKRADDGFFWWDFVHLSDSGAAIAAEAMAPPLQEFIEKRVFGKISKAKTTGKKGKQK